MKNDLNATLTTLESMGASFVAGSFSHVLLLSVI